MEEIPNRATLSVAIIAKNEAATITPAIESFAGIADEVIVLVDTSTTDNTKELAEKAGAVCYPLVWEDNFAAARNAAMVKCTKEWIFILDGHEILNPKSKQVLFDLLVRVTGKRDMHDTEVFSAYVYMNPEGENIDMLIPETVFMQPRLIKNNGDHYYVGRVHNYLTTKEGNTGLKRPVPELVVIHKRTEKNAEARKGQRAEMNVRILLDDIQENPSNSRPYFYLGNTYFELKDWEKAEEYYNKYLELSTWNHERAEALMMLAAIYAEQKLYDKARAASLRCIQEDWERPEFYLALGDIAYAQQQYYEAVHWYKSACDMRLPVKSGMFLRGASYTYLPYAKLAMVFSVCEDYWQAIQNGEKALSLGYSKPDLKEKMTIWRTQLTLKPNCKNILMYDENGAFTFLKDLSNRLMQDYNIATAQEFEYEYAQWADIIWFEWCAKNVVRASGMKKKPGQKWVVRLHGYEVYSPKRIKQIMWDKIDVLIFVCEHVKAHFNELYTIPESVKQVVIPNGIDLNNFDFADRNLSNNKNIGVIGILTEKKGVQLLAQTIRYFSKYHPEYKFLLRMDIVETPCMAERVLTHAIKDLTNWEWVPRQESLNSWMEDIKYLLSSSELESFSFVIGEAMAKGIKPLIYNWLGATDIWPLDLIWKDLDDLEKLLNSEYTSSKYRDYVKDNYSIEQLYDKTKALLSDIYEISAGEKCE